MAEPKTRPTDASVADFLSAVDHPRRRADAEAVCAMMQEVMGEPPVMWGESIVGFGRYVAEVAKPMPWPVIAFSPRKANLVLYIMNGSQDRPDLIARLGKVKTSAACLYVNRLDDVDPTALRELMAWSAKTMRKRYPTG